MSITFKTGKNPSCFLRVLENSLEIQYVSYRLQVTFGVVLMMLILYRNVSFIKKKVWGHQTPILEHALLIENIVGTEVLKVISSN
jgi:hypothetical protein